MTPWGTSMLCPTMADLTCPTILRSLSLKPIYSFGGQESASGRPATHATRHRHRLPLISFLASHPLGEWPSHTCRLSTVLATHLPAVLPFVDCNIKSPMVSWIPRVKRPPFVKQVGPAYSNMEGVETWDTELSNLLSTTDGMKHGAHLWVHGA